MKRLNAKGISHLLIPIVVVVLVAAVGTFMLVSSHAASRGHGLDFYQQNGSANVKNVISHSGKSVVVTDLKFKLVHHGSAYTTVSKVTIGGKRADVSRCDSNSCDWSIRVQGDHKGDSYMTKVYQKGSSSAVYSSNVKYNTSKDTTQ